MSRHTFCFDETANGGEQLMVTTEFFSNGDPGEEGVYTNHQITLESYGNSASINLSGCQITPEILRKLANELEQAKIKFLNGGEV